MLNLVMLSSIAYQISVFHNLISDPNFQGIPTGNEQKVVNKSVVLKNKTAIQNIRITDDFQKYIVFEQGYNGWYFFVFLINHIPSFGYKNYN